MSSEQEVNSLRLRKQRRGKRAELPTEIALKLKSCSVLNCEDWRDLTEFTTYHCFPTGDKNQDRWDIWTHLLRKARDDESWIPFRGSLVCSHHFRPQDFVRDTHSKRRKLIKDAIPSIFPGFTVDLNDPEFSIVENHEGEGERYEDYGENDYDNSNNEYPYYEDEDGSSQNAGEEEFLDFEYENEDTVDEGQVIRMQSLAQSVDNFDDSSNEIPSSSRSQTVSGSRQTKQASHFKSFLPSSNGVTVTISHSPGKKFFQGANQTSKDTVPSSSNKLNEKSWQGVDFTTAKRFVSDTTSVSANSAKFVPFSQTIKENNDVNGIPFPLYINPDLEIEMVEPEDDLATSKQKISELELENQALRTAYENAIRSLKGKYERQILVLKKRIQEQDALLQNGEIGSNGFVSTKKIRLA